MARAIILNLLILRRRGRFCGGNFLGRSGLERGWGKYTDYMGSIEDLTFPLVLVSRVAAFGGWGSGSDSESEESSEEDESEMGFFTAGFSAGFGFWGLAAYGGGVGERGGGGSCELPGRLLRPLR